ESHAAVAWVEEHALVLPHRGDEPAVPTLALAAQDQSRFGDLRPGHGIGDERYLVADLLAPQMTVQAHDEVQVLHDARCVVPADGDEVFLAEQSEGAGDDEATAEAVPAEAAEQEGAQVLDHLDAGEEAVRDTGVGHAAVLDGAAVGDAHGPADRGDPPAEEKWTTEPEQRVGLDERVGVHGDNEGEAACVDGGIERIRLAAVL